MDIFLETVKSFYVRNTEWNEKMLNNLNQTGLKVFLKLDVVCVLYGQSHPIQQLLDGERVLMCIVIRP